MVRGASGFDGKINELNGGIFQQIMGSCGGKIYQWYRDMGIWWDIMEDVANTIIYMGMGQNPGT